MSVTRGVKGEDMVPTVAAPPFTSPERAWEVWRLSARALAVSVSPGRCGYHRCFQGVEDGSFLHPLNWRLMGMDAIMSKLAPGGPVDALLSGSPGYTGQCCKSNVRASA